MVAACERPVAVSGNEGDRLDRRTADALDDELPGQRGEPAKTAFLPRRDERANPCVVDDRGSSRREREPPAGTFAAPAHRPGGRRATSPAKGVREAGNGPAAALAEVTAGLRTDHTPARKDEIQEITDGHMATR